MTHRSEPWRTHPLGTKAVKFLSKLTLIGSYSGEPWVLDPWQEEVVRELYGTRNEDHTRKYTKLSLWIARGNAKTQLAAGLALYQLICGPPGQEIYAASSDREKASRIYKAVAQMVRQDPGLRKYVDLSDYNLRAALPGKSSLIQCLAADSDRGNSLAPSTLILDELHLWKSRSMYDALTSGFSKRKKGERLEVQISTAGKEKQGLAWDLFCHAKAIKEGTRQDPRTLVRIFEAPEHLPWDDPKTWRIANPSSFVDFDALQEEVELGRHIKHKELSFRQFHLNQWVEQSADTWLSPEDWDKCIDDYTVEEMYGAKVFVALDLSSIRDLTSLTLFFSDTKRVLSWSWTPSLGIAEKENKDGVPYRAWAKQGFIFTCPGDHISHRQVADFINKLLPKFDVMEFVIDPHDAYLIAPYLDREPETYRQTPGYMSPPCKWFEIAVANHEMRHNGNPLFNWCISKIAIDVDKKTGALTTDKSKSSTRIDPVVALIMAIGAWLGSENTPKGPDLNAFYSDKANFTL